MLNYSIGEFFGILLTFGILMFFSLVGLKGIFIIVSDFFDKGISGITIHQHLKDPRSGRRSRNL